MQTAQPTPLSLNATGHSDPIPVAETRSTGGEDHLVGSRLGVYAGLFFALRAKHPPTAAHSLRVALACAKWGHWRNLDPAERSALEVSALFHDIGKIGIPDSVLQKPSQLSGQEQLMMEMNAGIAHEILTGARVSEAVLNTLKQARVPFSEGQELATTARMLAITDAFDSMTTEQVFRRALSRERALEELCSHAGSQFDPSLVAEFAEMLCKPCPEVEVVIAESWLRGLDPNATMEFDTPSSSGAVQNLVDTLFHSRLLDTLPDAAVYLDASGQILHWNRTAERMSGRQAKAVANHRWHTDLFGLVDAEGRSLSESDCPFKLVTQSNTKNTARLQVRKKDGNTIQVHLAAMPINSRHKEFAGAIILVRDASAQAQLEERVHTLNVIACQDTLTKVANRAELTRRLPEFVKEHMVANRRGSMIMCDIDFFKRINDNFGHQAGDEALVTFASLLRENAREGDLVARYGGEEFVILCGDCDNPGANQRAEQLRRVVEQTPVPALDRKTMTSSFGVTEIQEGDTAETLLARADRALLMAKEMGRNRVVQLGAGQFENSVADGEPQEKGPSRTESEPKANWLSWFRASKETIVEREFLAAVPQEVAIQKLKGFIADHNAEVISADESHVAVRIDGSKSESIRRRGERPAVMLVEIALQTVQICMHGRKKVYQNRTRFSVAVRAVRARDRRSEVLLAQCNQIIHSFQAYMVAQEIDEELRLAIIEPR